MINLAAELKHSETAFVMPQARNQYKIRYFTAAGEVDLCGHATISVFTVLRNIYGIKPGLYAADTLDHERTTISIVCLCTAVVVFFCAFYRAEGQHMNRQTAMNRLCEMLAVLGEKNDAENKNLAWLEHNRIFYKKRYYGEMKLMTNVTSMVTFSIC